MSLFPRKRRKTKRSSPLYERLDEMDSKLDMILAAKPAGGSSDQQQPHSAAPRSYFEHHWQSSPSSEGSEAQA